jgi:TPR repeat protein
MPLSLSNAKTFAMLRFVLICLFIDLQITLCSGMEQPFARQENLVELCDQAAAAPWDPDSAHRRTRLEFRQLQPERAIPFCQRAFAQNSDLRRLSFQLGRAYDRQGANQDAYRAYKVAADLGSAAAKVNIGILYRQGRRFEQNDTKARAWFREAAEMGLAEGMYCYATALDNGLGGPVDGSAARSWYERAAQRGTAKARDVLVRLEIDGPGTGARCD